MDTAYPHDEMSSKMFQADTMAIYDMVQADFSAGKNAESTLDMDGSVILDNSAMPSWRAEIQETQMALDVEIDWENFVNVCFIFLDLLSSWIP